MVTPALAPRSTLVITALVSVLLTLLVTRPWHGTGNSTCSNTGRLSSGPGTRTGKVLVFQHIFAINNYREVVQDQVTKILFSGLYHTADAVYSTVSGEAAAEVDAAVELFSSYGERFVVLEKAVGSVQFERLTLKHIRNLTAPGDKVLYLHSKGVTARHQVEPAHLRVYQWRTAMSYFLIYHHQAMLRLLDDFDVVGIDYVKDTDVMPANISYFTHFSGNFWWTRADYWHSLADTIGPDYYDPERFLFTGKPRTACVYYTGFQGAAHYWMELPPKEYTDVIDVSVARVDS